MLRARTIVAAILGVALMGSAWGQSPQSLQPQPKTENGQQQSSGDQRGTETSPFVIKILPTANNPEETERPAQDEEDKSGSEWTSTDIANRTRFIVASSYSMVTVTHRDGRSLEQYDLK
jgi:hypothetical protein